MNCASKTIVVFALLTCAAPVMSAEESDDHGLGVSVGLTGGTNGLGLEAGYRFTRFVGVRANTGNYKYDKTVDSDDFTIDGKARLKSFGALVDLYPFGGSFHVSAGLRSNKNRFAGIATPDGATVELNGEDYTAAEVGQLSGTASFKKSAPTFTLGWSGKFRKGLHFGAELGVVAQGSPQLAATSSGTLANDPTFRADLDEKLAEWEDDAKDYKFWPVIQLHLAYRF